MFPEDPDVAVAIARAESSLNPHQPSNTDITKDGKPYSFGLFQINLTVSNVGGVPCNQAFSGTNNNSVVVNHQLYEQCVSLASDIDTNIQCARGKYIGRGNWTAWGSYTNKSFLRHL
jgi:hypothetical protein